MMQIVACHVCGNSRIPFGETSVTVIFNKTVRTCEHCNGTREEKTSDFICSQKCFAEYCAMEAKAMGK